jgi:hypothetical protein
MGTKNYLKLSKSDSTWTVTRVVAYVDGTVVRAALATDLRSEADLTFRQWAKDYGALRDIERQILGNLPKAQGRKWVEFYKRNIYTLELVTKNKKILEMGQRLLRYGPDSIEMLDDDEQLEWVK